MQNYQHTKKFNNLHQFYNGNRNETENTPRVGGRITVWLVYSLTSLDLTNQ